MSGELLEDGDELLGLDGAAFNAEVSDTSFHVVLDHVYHSLVPTLDPERHVSHG
jgi:hypothetical protein